MLIVTHNVKITVLTALLFLASISPGVNAGGIECFEIPDQSYCSINLSSALQLQTSIGGIDDSDPWAIRIKGDVVLKSTVMALPLADTNLVLKLDKNTGEMLEFYGMAILPLDHWKLMQDLKLTAEPPTAMIGLFQQQTVEQIFADDLPLNNGIGIDSSKRTSKTPYMIFHAASGAVSMDLNEAFNLGMSDKSSLQLKFSENQSVTYIIDVADPYVMSGQGYSASFTFSAKGDEPPKLEKANTYLPVQYEVKDENGEVLSEITEYYNNDGKLVSKFILDPITGGMVRNDVNPDGSNVVSFYQRDESGDFVREGTIKEDGDHFKQIELDNGLDVADINRQRMNGFKVINYNKTDKDRNITSRVVEYLDAKGKLVNKFVHFQDDGRLVKLDFDSDDNMTESTYYMDGEGDFVRDGGSKNNGDYFNTAELDNGVDVNDPGRSRNADTETDTDADTSGKDSKRHKFDLGIDAFAFSWNGWIPFEAQTIFGVPEESRQFSGSLYMKGAITFDGSLVLDGETITYIGEEGFVMGGNGDLALTIPGLPDFIDFSLYLGSASTAFQISPEKQITFLSGVMAPDVSLFEKILPFTPSGKVEAVGYIDNKLGDSNITLQGTFSLGTALVGDWIGVELNDLAGIEGYASINSEGVKIHGVTNTQIHPSIKFAGELTVDAEFSWLVPGEFRLFLSGTADIYGVGLEDVSIEINSQGVFVNGAFVTPLSRIALAGNITSQGPSISGFASIMLGLGDLTATMQDAANTLKAAQDEVKRLDAEINHQREIVQAIRDEHARKLTVARNAVSVAQKQVDRLNFNITSQRNMINKRKAEIKRWYKWYKQAKWYQKASRYSIYVYEKSWRSADIASRETTILAHKAALAVAKASLDATRLTLHGLVEATVITPIDLDPKVASVIVAKEAAVLTLEMAKAPFENVPVIDHDFAAHIKAILDRHGLRGTVSANFDGYNALSGRLELSGTPKACIDFPGIGVGCTDI